MLPIVSIHQHKKIAHQNPNIKFVLLYVAQRVETQDNLLLLHSIDIHLYIYRS